MDCRFISFGLLEIEGAPERDVEDIARGTAEACELLSASDPNSVSAVLHLTC